MLDELRILDPMLTLNIQTPQVPGEITLNWTDFVTGEQGCRVQRSSDGVNFSWYKNVQITHSGGALTGGGWVGGSTGSEAWT